MKDTKDRAGACTDRYSALLLENQLCFPLYAASREVIRLYRPLLDPMGITYTQYVTMMAVWQEGPLSVKDLGRSLRLDSGTLTPVLKSLEARGLVNRRRCVDDERVCLVSATEAGMELREKALGVPDAVRNCLRLESSELSELYRLLHKLLGDGEDGDR